MTSIFSIDSRVTGTYITRGEASTSAASANLSSGKKLNANVADLSVGTVLATRVATLRTANLNAGQGSSLVSTAKGAYSTINDLLQKQKNLAVKANDASLGETERGFLNQEFQALKSEIDRIAENTTFNGKKLIDGSLSGSSNITTATTETVQNYSVTSIGAYGLRYAGSLASGYLATSSTFTAVDATNVGAARGSTIMALDTADSNAGTTLTLTIGDGAGSDTVTFLSGASDAATAANLVAAANAKTTSTARLFRFTDLGGGSVGITAANLGNESITSGGAATAGLNFVTFSLATAGTTVTAATIGGDTIAAGACESLASIATATNRTLGAFRGGSTTLAGENGTLSTTENTYDSYLLGAATNFSATVVEGAGTRSNAVVFQATINGKQYISQEVSLTGNGGINSRGNIIASGESIMFYRQDGRQDTTGDSTDNAFSLSWGSSDTTLSGTTVTAVNLSLAAVATSISTQLSSAVITQDRNIAMDVVSTTDDKLKSALGTIFGGMQGYDVTNNVQGDIVFRNNSFDSAGTGGRIGAFTFNRDTGKLQTTIDNVVYSADLSTNTTTDNGTGYITGGTAYNTSTRLLTFDSNTIVMRTESTSDQKELRINLNNATTDTLELDSEASVTNLQDALNTIFNVSASDSLTFQVGVTADDAISVALNGASSTDIYKTASGTLVTLDVLDQTAAQTASNILDLAINRAVSFIADTNATLSRLDSAKSNNEISIQNGDAARSRLLDTDYSSEATMYAEATVSVQAATSILAQSNARLQQILQLLRQ